MCARPLIARDNSGTREELRSYSNPSATLSLQLPDPKLAFLIKFVVNMSTSVSALKLCTAAKYPTLFCLNFGELMTSNAWKLAHDISCPNMSRYISFSTAVALMSTRALEGALAAERDGYRDLEILLPLDIL
jgi:hypothetical protein